MYLGTTADQGKRLASRELSSMQYMCASMISSQCHLCMVMTARESEA